MPEWYPLIKAARYLGVAPWELLEQPAIWVDWALLANEYDGGSQGGGCPLMGVG